MPALVTMRSTALRGGATRLGVGCKHIHSAPSVRGKGGLRWAGSWITSFPIAGMCRSFGIVATGRHYVSHVTTGKRLPIAINRGRGGVNRFSTLKRSNGRRSNASEREMIKEG